jgi:hypothetical protein
MMEIDIKEVSFVDKPANRKKFLFVKDQGGGDNMEPITLAKLSYEDRRTLEKEVEIKLLPNLKKEATETIKEEFEKKYDAEKIEAIKTEVRPEIEAEIRAEFGKVDIGISKEASGKITAALRDITRGASVISKLVGYGFKDAKGEDKDREAELEKSINEIKENMLTMDDLKEIVAGKKEE